MIGTKRALKAYIETLPDDATRYVIEPYKERRSKDANSLFHVCCDKIRLQLGVSMERIKNQLVGDYGAIMRTEDGEHMIYKTNAPPEFMMECSRPHTKLIKTGEENGKPVYYYRLYKNTADSNTAEMSRLIDGAIYECKQLGLDTTNPKEVERLKQMWGIDVQK